MNPLAPIPMTPDEIADLIRRARESQHRVMTKRQRKAVAASCEAYHRRRSER